ncbi:MAG: hypothetical protein KJ879_03485, partial [Nanoarchaeota archaeon]|nr:hypothetical protein [Nanoarchaeota archaeon]
WVLVLIVIFLIVAVYFLITKTWDFVNGENNIQKCIEECASLKTELSLINPGSEEYLTHEEEIINKSETCLTLNKELENPLDETEILESCGISEAKTGCVESGETIYLSDLETCTDGIQKCCSSKGLCVTNKSHVQDYVACVPY